MFVCPCVTLTDITWYGMVWHGLATGRGFVLAGADYGKSLLEQTEPYFEQVM